MERFYHLLHEYMLKTWIICFYRALYAEEILPQPVQCTAIIRKIGANWVSYCSLNILGRKNSILFSCRYIPWLRVCTFGISDLLSTKAANARHFVPCFPLKSLGFKNEINVTLPLGDKIRQIYDKNQNQWRDFTISYMNKYTKHE